MLLRATKPAWLTLPHPGRRTRQASQDQRHQQRERHAPGPSTPDTAVRVGREVIPTRTIPTSLHANRPACSRPVPAATPPGRRGAGGHGWLRRDAKTDKGRTNCLFTTPSRQGRLRAGVRRSHRPRPARPFTVQGFRRRRHRRRGGCCHPGRRDSPHPRRRTATLPTGPPRAVPAPLGSVYSGGFQAGPRPPPKDAITLAIESLPTLIALHGPGG